MKMIDAETYNACMHKLSLRIKKNTNYDAKNILEEVLAEFGGVLINTPQSKALYEEAISGRPLVDVNPTKGVRSAWDPSQDGPKVTIELVMPHHEQQLVNYMDSAKLRSIMWELLNDIRNTVRKDAPFNGVPPAEGTVSVLENVRDWLNTELADKGINLD